MSPPDLPRRSPRQARSLATVEVILDATAHVLIEHGAAGLTTNRVAERGGVSIGSLYQYFPNKQALLAAVRRRHAAKMEAAALKAFQGPPAASFDDAMSQVIASVIEAHLIEADLHRALEREAAAAGGEEALDASMEKVRTLLAKVLTKHQGALQIVDGRASAFVLVEAIHAIAHAAVRHKRSGLSVRQLTRETALLARGYLNCPRTPAQDILSSQPES